MINSWSFSQHCITLLLLFVLQLEEAKILVRDAIAAGITNDMGSGSNVDLCVITKDGATYIRPYEVTESKGER